MWLSKKMGKVNGEKLQKNERTGGWNDVQKN